MTKSFVSRCAFMLAFLAGGTVHFGQSYTVNQLLEELVKDWKSGIPEELIITRIKKSGIAVNLSGEEIRALTDSGITSTVVKYLLDPSQPYSPAPPPPPPAAVTVPPTPGQPAATVPVIRTPSRVYPADSQASRVPIDPGLYRFVEASAMKTEIKLLLGENQGAGLGRLLMQKGKAVGYLLGPAANTKVSDVAPVFYLRLSEGKAIEEVVLLALSQTKERREIEIGQSLEKQELKSESMRPFESVEVGPQLFKIIPSKALVRGEYLFLLLGSAEPPKGSYGKVYDFSIPGPGN